MRFPLGFIAGEGPTTFLDMLNRNGLGGANVLGCWDAAALDSYNPSSDIEAQKWYDLAGNIIINDSHNQFLTLGEFSSPAATDNKEPTFNGTPGNLSPEEYFETDGNDQFTYFSNNSSYDFMHKANAQWTIAGIASIPSVSSGQTRTIHLLNNMPETISGHGFRLNTQKSGAGNNLFLNAAVNRGSTTPAWGMSSSTVTINSNEFFFFAVSVNDTTGSHVMLFNEHANTLSSSFFESPSSNAASSRPHIFRGSGSNSRAGSRIAAVSVISGAATQEQLEGLRNSCLVRWPTV